MATCSKVVQTEGNVSAVRALLSDVVEGSESCKKVLNDKAVRLSLPQPQNIVRNRKSQQNLTTLSYERRKSLNASRSRKVNKSSECPQEMDDEEFWMLLSNALNESSNEDDSGNDGNSSDDADGGNSIAVLQQAIKILTEKSSPATYIATPRMFDHHEILHHNSQEFKKTAFKDPFQRIFKCRACNQNYTCSTALTRHLKTHVCVICNKFFTLKSDLLDHKWNHRSEMCREKVGIKCLPPLYLISKNNRAIISKFTCKIISEKKYMCNPCCKNFLNSNALMRHMATHICMHCDIFFENRQKLKTHKENWKARSYSKDVKRHTCSSEGKVTNASNDLKEENVLLDKSKLKDGMPSQSFCITSPSTLLIESGAEKGSTVLSSVSEGTTTDSVSLPSGNDISDQQIVTVVPGDTGTQISTKTSVPEAVSDANSSSSLSPVSRLGTYILSAFSSPVTRFSRYSTSDMREKTKILFRCDVCKNTFLSKGNLKSHLQTHSNLKEYDCPVCGKLFRRKHTMQKHQKTHTT